jgi:2-polyprenyl-3-methyl-5-hydroxy-6-metoxy-1,4-benzoquinol methylase
MMQAQSRPNRSNAKKVDAAASNFGERFDGFFNRLLIRLRPLICPFEDLLDAVPSGMEVFDIGCGSGFWLYLIWLYRKPKRLLGVDPSRGKILAAKKAFSSIGLPTTFITQSDPCLWPNEKYSMVSMIDVLHHIPPVAQEAFFRAATSKVEKGGILIYKDMCTRPFLKTIFNQLHDLILAHQWIHHVDVKKVESWAADEGFVLDAKVDRTLYLYGHELRCFARPSK